MAATARRRVRAARLDPGGPEPNRSTGARRELLVAALLLAGTALIAYHGVWDGRRWTHFSLPDQGRQTYPWSVFLARSLAQGVFPLWDPYTYGGNSFAGNLQAGLFYWPQLVLFSVLGRRGPLRVEALDGFIIAHVWLASLGMYALARALGLTRIGAFVAGATFGFAGWLANQGAQQSPIQAAAAWMPWAVWMLVQSLRQSDRVRQAAWAGACGLVLAFSLTAGHVQPAFHTVLVLTAVTAWAIRRAWVATERGRRLARPLWSLAVAGAGAAMIGAICLVPSTELLARSFRWVGLDKPVYGMARVPFEAGEKYSTRWRDLRQVLREPIVSLRRRGDATKSPYFGIVACGLAVGGLARRWRGPLPSLAAGLAAFAFLDSLGPRGPVHWLVWRLVPFADKVRGPQRSLLLWVFAAALLAGWGAQMVSRRLATDRRDRLALLATVGVLLVGSWRATMPLRVALIGAAAVSGAALVAGARMPRRVPLYALIGAFLFELSGPPAGVFAGGRPYSPGQLFAPDPITDLLRERRKNPETFRVSYQVRDGAENWGDVAGMSTTLGFGPTIAGHYFDLLNVDWSADGVVHDLMAVRYVATARPVAGELRRILQAGDAVLYERPETMPMAWLASRAERLPRSVMVHRLRRMNRDDLRTTALLEIDTPLDEGDGSAGEAELVERGATRLRYRVRAERRAILMMSEVYDPGWRAKIDGRFAPVLRADLALRAVVVPTGSHDVVVEFRPLSVRLGAALTVTGLVAFAALVLAAGRRPEGGTPLFPAAGGPERRTIASVRRLP